MLLLALKQTQGRDVMSFVGRAWTRDTFGNRERPQGVSKLAIVRDL